MTDRAPPMSLDVPRDLWAQYAAIAARVSGTQWALHPVPTVEIAEPERRNTITYPGSRNSCRVTGPVLVSGVVPVLPGAARTLGHDVAGVADGCGVRVRHPHVGQPDRPRNFRRLVIRCAVYTVGSRRGVPVGAAPGAAGEFRVAELRPQRRRRVQGQTPPRLPAQRVHPILMFCGPGLRLGAVRTDPE